MQRPLGTASRALVACTSVDGTLRKKIVLIGIVLAEQKPHPYQTNRYEHEGQLSSQISSSTLGDRVHQRP